MLRVKHSVGAQYSTQVNIAAAMAGVVASSAAPADDMAALEAEVGSACAVISRSAAPSPPASPRLFPVGGQTEAKPMAQAFVRAGGEPARPAGGNRDEIALDDED